MGLTKEQQSVMRKLFESAGLVKEDVFTHKHYTIITRTGIEKIQYFNKISVFFDPVQIQKDFDGIKATGTKDDMEVQTFGSAAYGKPFTNDKGKWEQTGSTDSWYVAEIAEKRALSRVVLKLMKLYELNVFGEDEGAHKQEDSE